MNKKMLIACICVSNIICIFNIIGCSADKNEFKAALVKASARPTIGGDKASQNNADANNLIKTSGDVTVKAKGTETKQERLQANADFFRSTFSRNISFEQASSEEKLVGKTVSVADEQQETKRDELKEFPVFSEILKRDIKELPSSLWRDTKRVYTDKTNLAVLLIAGGASLAVRNTVDDKWEHHFDRHRSLRSEWGDLGGALGNPGVHLGIAALGYYCGVKGGDTKLYYASKALFNALVINDLSTVMLKLAACTDSPNGEHFAWPSGHMSSSVCLAAVLDKYYGHKVGIPLYLLAGFVGFERMDDREHHFSDIVFGAALGYVIGKTVADGHSPEVLGGRVVPYIDPYDGRSGIAWVKDF